MADANPYAQFDNLRWSPEAGAVVTDTGRLVVRPEKPESAPADGSNPYAQFDRLRGDNPAPRGPTVGSVAMQVPTGFNEATADVLGAPVDAVTWALNKGIHGINSAANAAGYDAQIPDIQHPFGGSESIKRGMAAVGVPNPDDVQPQNAAERIARGTGAGVAGMIVPEAAVGALARTGAIVPRVAEVLDNTLGKSQGVGDVAKAGVVGATSGATGEGAAEIAPDQYKPAVRMAGSIVGGGAGALAAEAPGVVAQAARGVREYAAPMSRAGQEATAGRILADRASNPQNVIDRIDDTGATIPETPATLSAQLAQLGQSRAVVMIPAGTPHPTGIPPGMRAIRTERGIYLYDPTKITPDAILQASRNGTENEILGYGPFSKPDVMHRVGAGETPVAVTERAPDGTELKAAAGTDRTAPAQVAALEAQKGQGSIVRVETPENVIAQRLRPHELVPGSQPTTFQLTGDMGLGSLEREYQTRYPADFQQRRADQNAARLDALPSSSGNPADLSAALRRQLGEMDQTTNAAIEQATADARTQADAIGGQTPPEQRGAAVRGVLQDAENAARTRESALWKAVDPDGRLAISMGPIQAAADRVYGNLTAAAEAGLTPSERTVRQVIQGYRGVEPFRELTDLRSAVSSAMRSELATAGRTPAYARLSQLRAGIEDAIGSAVEHQAAQEQQAVARGEMSPEQTAAARIRDWQDAWYSQQAEARASDAASAGGNAGSRSVALPSSRGAAGQARERSGDPAGNQGLPQDDGLQPNFDQSARERLNTATAATRERASTFNQGPVGQVLRTQGQRGNYRMLDAGVGDAMFKPGPKGFETVQAFRRAAGDDPAVAGLLQDVAASSLRQYAVGPDGVLNPQRYASWLQKYGDALRAMPGDLASQFGDAATATEAIQHVATIRREALETYQRGALAKVIGAQHPDDVTKAVGSIFTGKNPVGTMRELAIEASQDPAAKEGLRKAVVDYITKRFVSNTEAGTSGDSLLRADQFQEFVKTQAGALRQVLSAPEYNMLKAIAADLRRSSRSLNAVKIPGQSNTAQDALPELKKAMTTGSGSLLTQLVLAGGGGYGAGGIRGALAGVAGVLGKNVIGRMHEAGMAKVDDLVKEALLDPQLARYLLSKAPEKAGTGPVMSLADRLRRLSMFSASQALPGSQQPENR